MTLKKETLKKDKAAQVWFLDFMAGLFIFLVVVIFYYNYYENMDDEVDTAWNEMVVDSKTISSSLMSEGYPIDWSRTNVDRIGLSNNNFRLNESKLIEFLQMEYNTTQKIFATRFEYYFFLEDKNDNQYYHVGRSSENSTRLVQTTRLVIYNSSMYRMVLYVWE